MQPRFAQCQQMPRRFVMTNALIALHDIQSACDAVISGDLTLSFAFGNRRVGKNYKLIHTLRKSNSWDPNLPGY